MMQCLKIKNSRKIVKKALAALLVLAGVTAQTSFGGAAAFPGMTNITAGAYLRGDLIDHNQDGDAPAKWVNMTADYQIDTNLVTYGQWVTVFNWATNNGYKFSTNGSAFGTLSASSQQPVHSMNWYDAVKWCNARSEKEGKPWCYFTDAGHANPYRTGEIQLTAANVVWDAGGYRLPTEAEWEKAARGGLTGNRFPRTNTISHFEATYQSPLLPVSYDAGPFSTFPIQTTPAGQLLANRFGIHDMAGNLYQWCWDFYAKNYYTNSSSTNNPTGPANGALGRVIRGGAWNNLANALRTAKRANNSEISKSGLTGFRTVLMTSGSGNPTPTVAIINVGSYTYNGSAQGPDISNVDTGGSTGTVTLSYAGTGGTVYSPSQNQPVNAGTYTITATVGPDGNYSQASSPATPFTIGKATPTVAIINVGSYTYNGSAQGPDINNVDKGGSTGAATLNYAGTGYASHNQPTNVGNYTLTAIVAADSNYNQGSSPATPFTIATPGNNPGTGFVDTNALNTALGTTNKITLGQLIQVLQHYDHSGNGGIVDYTALTLLLGNDIVTTNDLFAVMNAFYGHGGKLPALSLPKLFGPSTNIVDQQGLNAVLAHYWSQNPPYITNATFPGKTNLCFNITNFVFTVQYSTNLTTWQTLDSPSKIQFTHTNSGNWTNCYYRLVGSTNY